MKQRLRVALFMALASVAISLPAAPARAQVETVVASDDFNRADELPFATTGNWGRTIAGNYDGVSNLTGNHVTAGTQEGIYYWKGPGTFSNTSQFARHQVLDSTGEPGIVLLGGADHAILLNWGPPGPGANKSVFIYWYANGQDQGVLQVQTSPLADGDVLEGVLDGGTIYAKVNGVTVASVPNTTTIASGTPGFITYLNPTLPTLVAGLDDWQAGTPVSFSISGTVTEDGLGRSGVLVTASGGFAGSATTDVNGNYTIAGVPVNATAITLTPTLADHTMSPVTRTVAGPVTGPVTGQDFVSTPIVSFPISGTVTEGGLGKSGVLVTASGGFAGSATTDVNGDYTIAGVPQNATAITLTPTLAGRTFTPVTRTIAGPVTADVTGQDFVGTPIPMTLTIIAANGTVTRNPDLPTYPAGTVVTLTAIPDVDYVFGGWTGDVPPGQQAANPLQVTMSQDRTLTAAFGAANVIAADNFNRANELPFATTGNWGRTIAGNYDGFANLTGNHVTAGTNEGIYYWKGAGTFSNTSQFARHQVLDATGEPGIVLLGGPDHAILLNWGPPGPGANKSVFIYWYKNGADQGVLQVQPSPLADGDVLEGVLDGGFIYAKVNGVTVASVANTTTIASGTPGFITYLNPLQPTLVAGLDDWEAGTPVSVAISGTVTEGGLGRSGVLVTASGGFGGSATTDVDGSYTIVGVPVNAPTITLTPSLVGHTFAPVTRTVTGPVTANVTGQDFVSTPITEAVLTILTNHGTVTRNPDLSPYPIGTVVTLTATPDTGYAFAGWSGDIPPGQGGANPLVVTMNQDRTITATFGSADVIASDDFNRANEIPLFVGGNWLQSFGGGTAHLVGNQIMGVTNDALYYWGGAGIFDNTKQYSRARVVNATGQLGLVLLGGAGQGLVTSWDDGVLYIYWYSGGSYRGNLATLPSTIQDGDIIEAEHSNGAVAAKINGTVVLSVPNTTTLTSGTPGFETFQTGGALDDWEAGTPFSFAISGTILENGVGLAGVHVNASGGFVATGVTTSAGAYTLTAVPLDSAGILLTPTLSGHAMSPLTRTVAGPVNVNVTGQNFTSTSTVGLLLNTSASHGTVQRSPDQPTYLLGTEVTLTPVADSGYEFAGWSGNVPPGQQLANPLVVTMDQNRTITALFVHPGVSAAEYFDRANEFPFATGGNWAQSFGGGSANLVGSQVTGGSGEAVYWWQGTGSFDDTKQIARARVTSDSGQVGLVLLGGPGQGIVVSWHNDTLFIYWYSSSIYRGNLWVEASAIAPGDVIEAELANGKIKAKINGVTVTEVSNTTTLTSGRPGFQLFQSGGSLDDWESGISTALPVPAFPYLR